MWKCGAEGCERIPGQKTGGAKLVATTRVWHNLEVRLCNKNLGENNQVIT